ncbi:hypothetical protein AVEN_101309-1 [Araneus ventricosus]|uniref:Uncharacterized protein n=1 Tax=Araneus ventricosus TaxID=182803 RepID=A0A4Y2IF39_ARAVE|nr:hypothetical protein AVEN_101309-1 [Araneus ventricosus]
MSTLLSENIRNISSTSFPASKRSEKHGKKLPREPSFLLGRNSGRRRVLSSVALRVKPIVSQILAKSSLAKIRELEVDSNDIDELVEEHNQDPITEDLKEFHCVSQQEVVEEEITAKQQCSNSIREMLKFEKRWETVASYIEKHHPNIAVAMRARNLFYDNAVSHFCQILKRWQKQMSLDSFLLKINYVCINFNNSIKTHSKISKIPK